MLLQCCLSVHCSTILASVAVTFGALGIGVPSFRPATIL